MKSNPRRFQIKTQKNSKIKMMNLNIFFEYFLQTENGFFISEFEYFL